MDEGGEADSGDRPAAASLCLFSAYVFQNILKNITGQQKWAVVDLQKMKIKGVPVMEILLSKKMKMLKKGVNTFSQILSSGFKYKHFFQDTTFH